MDAHRFQSGRQGLGCGAETASCDCPLLLSGFFFFLPSPLVDGRWFSPPATSSLIWAACLEVGIQGKACFTPEQKWLWKQMPMAVSPASTPFLPFPEVGKTKSRRGLWMQLSPPLLLSCLANTPLPQIPTWIPFKANQLYKGNEEEWDKNQQPWQC